MHYTESTRYVCMCLTIVQYMFTTWNWISITYHCFVGITMMYPYNRNI